MTAGRNFPPSPIRLHAVGACTCLRVRRLFIGVKRLSFNVFIWFQLSDKCLILSVHEQLEDRHLSLFLADRTAAVWSIGTILSSVYVCLSVCPLRCVTFCKLPWKQSKHRQQKKIRQTMTSASCSRVPMFYTTPQRVEHKNTSREACESELQGNRSSFVRVP